MSVLRLISDQGAGARRSIALTAAMAELHSEGKIPDTLRIYRYPESVLVGRNQDIAVAADLEACRKHGVEVARRVTGGGSIYMDDGVATWDLVLSRGTAVDLGLFASNICSAIASTLSQIGAEARFRPENDILVGNRKVAGASGYFDGQTLVYQGSLLFDPDFEKMAITLRLPSVRDDLVSLAAAVNRKIPYAEIALLLSQSIATVLNRSLAPEKISAEEMLRSDLLFAQLTGNDDFVLHGDIGSQKVRAA